MLMHWRITWGRRKLEGSDGQPTDPALSSSIIQPTLSPQPPRAYDFFRVFSTAQEAAAFRELRNEKAKDLPLPLIVKLYEETQGTGQLVQ